MSLVGTRPPTVDEWEQYELHHRSRMSTKPGITGMWQVSSGNDIFILHMLQAYIIHRRWLSLKKTRSFERVFFMKVVTYVDTKKT